MWLFYFGYSVDQHIYCICLSRGVPWFVKLNWHNIITLNTEYFLLISQEGKGLKITTKFNFFCLMIVICYLSLIVHLLFLLGWCWPCVRPMLSIDITNLITNTWSGVSHYSLWLFTVVSRNWTHCISNISWWVYQSITLSSYF